MTAVNPDGSGRRWWRRRWCGWSGWARPPRIPGRGGAGRHQAVVRLHAQQIVIAHLQIVWWGCVIRPAVCNNP